MKKYSITLLLFSSLCYGTVNTDSPPYVASSSDGVTFVDMISEASTSGDGTTETGQHKAYLAIRNLNQMTGAVCPLLSTEVQPITCTKQELHLDLPVTSARKLPTYNSGDFGSSQIKTRLKINNTSTNDRYLYAGAVLASSIIKPFPLASGNYYLVAGTTSETIDLSFEINDFCDAGTSAECNVTNAYLNTVSPKVVFFLSDDNDLIGAGTTTTSTAISGNAVFIQYYLSDNIPDSTSERMSLDELKKGDGRARAVVSNGPSLGGYRYKIAVVDGVLVSSSTTYLSSDDVLDAGENPTDVINKYIDPMTSGEFNIIGLKNGTNYLFSVVMIDKFHFASFLSNSISVTPQQIDAFLEAQGCYLLSAGFQEEHYVIDYYKMVRDHYLSKFAVGRSFIHWYYQTAPKYTHYIYNSEFISAIVRGIAFVGYFLMHFRILIILTLTVFFALFQMFTLLKKQLKSKRCVKFPS